MTAIIATILLTGGGIVAVQTVGADVLNRGSRQRVPETSAKRVVPQIEPTAQVAVLNGTATPGFAAVVDAAISENDWGQILFSGEAAAHDVQISAVFYTSSEHEAAALGLAQQLGGVSTFQNENYTEYGADLVVLLGSDYGGPGSDQMVVEEPAG